MSLINMSDLRLNASNLRGLAEAVLEHAEAKASKKDDQIFKDFKAAIKNVSNLAAIAPKLIGKQINVASILQDAGLILQLADVDFKAIGEDLLIAKAFILTVSDRMFEESKAEAGKFLLGIWVVIQGETVDKDVCSRVAKQMCLHLDHYLDAARQVDPNGNTGSKTDKKPSNSERSWRE